MFFVSHHLETPAFVLNPYEFLLMYTTLRRLRVTGCLAHKMTEAVADR